MSEVPRHIDMEPKPNDWRSGLEAAKTLSEYVRALDALPVAASPEEVRVFLSGDQEDGFLNRLKSMSGDGLPDDLEEIVADGIMVFDSIDEYGLEGYTYAALASKLRSAIEDGARHESFRDLYTSFLESFRKKIVGSEHLREEVRQVEQVEEESLEDELNTSPQRRVQDEVWEDDEAVSEVRRSEELLFANFEDLIDGLGVIGTKEHIPLILKALETLPHGMLNRAAGRALSKIDAPAAAAELLGRIRSREADSEDKRLYSRVLYLVELGRVGISEQGAEYLGKQYDLGAYNDPGFFAHRITAEGDVGIFDDKKVLQKYFHVGDVSADEQLVHATVLDITADRLFLQTGDEGNTEERDRLIAEFKEKYFDVFDDAFFQETGVRFNDLTLREQFWFLQFILHGGAEKQAQALELVKKYKEPGLRTFLSFEFDSQVGDRVFSIAEHSTESQARSIFKKYEDILQTVEEVKFYVRSTFPEDAVSDADIAAITKNIALRANGVLVQFADGLAQGKAEGNDRKDLRKDLLETLQEMRADVILFANTFRIAAEKGGLHFEDIEGVQLYHKDSSTLTPEEKASMIETFVANRRGNAAAYPKVWRDKRKQEFSDLLDSPDKKFYLLTHDDNVLAFLHLEPREDGTLYLGSVNVNTEGRGKKIGGAFLRTVLEKEGTAKPMELIVNSKNAIAKSYEKDFGFEITETVEDYHGSGQRYYRMQRPAGGARPEKLKAAA